MGCGRPLVLNLGDLNPVVGLCLNGASIFSPLHHDLVVLCRFVVVGE